MSLEELYRIFLQYPVISTDTRKIAPQSLFFALKGAQFNGNTFAQQALESGAAYAIIDEPEYRKNVNTILVENVLTTLQQLALHHRNQFTTPIIAIAGSNGKTTTKELITSVLSQQYAVWATPGNFNNHIGVPLTLLQLKAEHEIAVIELGANHVGENAALCKLAMPTHGLVTNNGKDHLEGFGSIEGVAQSNSELYYHLWKHSGHAFVNANDEWLMHMANRLTDKTTYAAQSKLQQQPAADIGIAIQLQPQIIFEYKGLSIQSRLSGDYNFDNIMAAISIGSYFNIVPAKLKDGIEKYVPTNNRSQVIHKKNNTVYLDAYNANPSSVEASLRNFLAMPFSNKVVILGDMFELGKYADEEHEHIANLCATSNASEVWLIGEHFTKTLVTGVKKFLSTHMAIEYIKQYPFTEKHILIKGSRSMKLELLEPFIS
jgi:UDP-N-acetylmuramoyl-tripeptide--D-alanyl-D-alanine ligase